MERLVLVYALVCDTSVTFAKNPPVSNNIKSQAARDAVCVTASPRCCAKTTLP